MAVDELRLLNKKTMTRRSGAYVEDLGGIGDGG